MKEVFNKLMVSGFHIKKYVLEKADLPLLLFLLFMFNYRFSFKIAALVGIYLYRPDFKIKRDGIVYFYFFIMVLGLFNSLFIHRDYSYNHFMTVFAGCAIWLTCLLSYHQVKLTIDKTEPFKIVNTLKIFVALNFIVSLMDIVKVMLVTHSINPYTQIYPPPYGVSSGDAVGGIFGQVHLVNTVISCLLTVFFIYNRSFLFVLFCLIPFLLTGSNLATLLLTAILLFIMVFKKDKLLKYYAVFSILISIVFYVKITPSNQLYMTKTLEKIAKQFKKPVPVKPLTPEATAPLAEKKLTKEELIDLFIMYKQKLRPDTANEKIKVQQESVFKSVYAFEKHEKNEVIKDENFFFQKKDSLRLAKLKNQFFDYGQLKKFDLNHEAGKITSFKQTKTYLSASFSNALFGSGIGSFSSRLAFITSGIANDSRILKSLPAYETPEFKENHKAIFKYLMYLDDETHSITNLPFSWYNGLLGEYGLIGFFVFGVCYLGFFVKRFSLMSYGKILFMAMLAFFFFDYWYERLSVIMLFELIVLLDIKMKKIKTDQLA